MRRIPTILAAACTADAESGGPNTVFEGSGLRTYVRITAESESPLAWYALDRHGQIAGVWLGAEPPVFKLVPAGDGEFRQRDLSGADS